MHPIIEDLKDSQYKWLYELLLAFNAGSLGKFESLLPYVQQEVLECRAGGLAHGGM